MLVQRSLSHISSPVTAQWPHASDDSEWIDDDDDDHYDDGDYMSIITMTTMTIILAIYSKTNTKAMRTVTSVNFICLIEGCRVFVMMGAEWR